MSRFYKIKIKKIIRETPDCVSLSLDVPDDLKEIFRYNQGQYLTFRRSENGEEVRRSYSLCSSPVDGEWKVAIKKVTDGRFSTYATSILKVGEELEVMPPAGRFYTMLNKDNEKNYLFFAAGSGITPVLSIIKTILYTETKSVVTLIYGNKGRNSIIFKEDIEGLKNKYINRMGVHHILSREQGDTELLFGRIDRQKVKLILEKIISQDQIDECFVCGPEEMVLAVAETLTNAGLDKKKIHSELFTTLQKGQQKYAAKILTKEEQDKKSHVIIKLDGTLREMDMSYYGDTILDAALATGADLPFSCKGGMCSTCRAKVIKGKVEMDVNYSLEPDEVAAGYVLTCQARPLTEEIEVDFDV